MAQQFDYPKTETDYAKFRTTCTSKVKKPMTPGDAPRSRAFWKSCQRKQPSSLQFIISRAITAVKHPALMENECGRIICKDHTQSSSEKSRLRFFILKHRKFAGSILTNRGKPKSAHSEYQQFEIVLSKSA